MTEPVSQLAKTKRRKAAKGTVQIQTCNNRLRLCWSHGGKRYYLYPELGEGEVERRVAEAKAKLIELDILSGNFDPTLDKYKPAAQKLSLMKVPDLVDRWLKWKRRQIEERTVDKYEVLFTHCKRYFFSRLAREVTPDRVEDFKHELLKTDMELSTVKECIWLGQSCWKWAIAEKIVDSNPWAEILPRIKVPPKQRKKPFSREEAKLIIQGFRTHVHFKVYTPLVIFMLNMGCRPGEAAALRWKHISEDCSQVWIGQNLGYKKKVKQTKTNTARTVNVPKTIQKLLLDLRAERLPDDEALVFPAPKGSYIDDHCFRRPWRKVLDLVGVEYRSINVCRHTQISISIADGVDPAAIAHQVGNSVKIIFKNYASNIHNCPQLSGIDDDD